MHIEVHREGFGPIEWSVSSDPTLRKQQGLFFTPWSIAAHLADRLALEVDDDVLDDDFSICDPFVGAGVLPAAVVESLSPRASRLWGVTLVEARRRLLTNVFGVDLEAGHLDRSRRVLTGSGALIVPARENFGAFDALTSPVGAEEDTSSWGAWPQVFERGGFDVVVSNPPWEKARVNDREFFSGVRPGFSRLPRAKRDEIRSVLLTDDSIRDAYGRYVERIATLKRAARSDYEATGAGGDLDLYKLAVERVIQLSRPGGFGAVIVPHGLLGDWGARRLRRLLFNRCRILSITRLETGPDLFPEIHANLGVILLVFRKTEGAKNASVRVSPAVHSGTDLDQPQYTAISTPLLTKMTPHHMIPLVDDDADIELLETCLCFPSLGDWDPDLFRPRREIDMTNDRRHFRPVGEGTPLLEGKHLSPYVVRLEDRRWDVDPSIAHSSRWQRICWRAVADRAMRRRLIAAWVPSEVGLGNSLIYTGGADVQPENLLWLLAWMNSRVAEAQLRLWCANNNINIFHLKVCRAPLYDAQSARHRRIVTLANRLVSRFTEGTIDPLGAGLDRSEPAGPANIENAELDDLWKSVYGFADSVWGSAVLRRARPVSDWHT